MNTAQHKVAIVTGASRGIGAELAKNLAEAGIRVVVNYAHSPEKAEDVVREINARGGSAIALKASLAEPAGARVLFDVAEKAFGRVDILINNAGSMALSPLAEMTDEAFEQMLALNLSGSFRTMREAAVRLNDGGRIINFSSSVVGLYQPGYAAYAATKAGVEAMTKILAKELGPRAITVNAVAPGPVATELFLEGKSDALIDKIKGMNPFGRLGEANDIARIVRFLASEESGWINGQIIRANGGVV
ncbi:SDR family oxidoreductase [Erwinia sp. 9145]|uniref:SDR family oxidoreductase n=1 Tax=Erwinia sp. 9145 TaxID=1500895 RepID=UPI0005522316|nr:SDR family oxidoreductase [Erwinia sp. 9145]